MKTAMQVIADFSENSIIKQIKTKVLSKLLISKGLKVDKDFDETIKFVNVVTHDGRVVPEVDIRVVIKFEIKEGMTKSRGGFEPADNTVAVRPMTKSVEKDAFNTYIPSSSVNFSAYCSTIVHEVSHLIDHTVSTYDELFDTDKTTIEQKIANWNKPGEFRGFLHQLIYQIEARIIPKLAGAVTRSNIKGHPDTLRSLDMEPSEFLTFCKETSLYADKLDSRIDILNEENKKKMYSALSILQSNLRRKYMPSSGYTGASVK